MARRVQRKKRPPTQALDDDTLAVDARKRMKTATSSLSGDAMEPTSQADQTTRRSNRSNIGKGGQKSQLENIERLQTQTSTKVSKLAAATSNEPLNPMAPMPREDARFRTSKGTSVDAVSPDALSHPSAHQPPVPVYQASAGSRYGFGVVPASRAGSVVPPTRSGSIAPSRTGSIVPPSRAGSIVPSSRAGSVVPPSRAGSTYPPPSRADLTGVSSRAGSTTSTSHGEPFPSAFRNVSNPCSTSHLKSTTSFGSQLPLRSSQVVQRTRVPFTRMYSAHCPEEMSRSTRNDSWPSSYYSHNDDTLQEDEDRSQNSHNWNFSRALPGDITIDEASPDEDEREAEAALWDTDDRRRTQKSHDTEPAVSTEERRSNRFDDDVIDPALLNGEYSHRTRGPPPATEHGDDNDFDDADGLPDLPTRERVNSGTARDVMDEYHQRNRFPRPPHPTSLLDIRRQQQTSNPNNPGTGGNRAPSPVTSHTLAEVPLGPLGGPANKLRAYPHKFREVIERAKQISQCECGLVDPFPSRADFLDRKSAEHFTEAIAESQHVPNGYWPQYKKELGILLWEALMSWRSTLKAKAREVVARFYNLGEDQSPEMNKTNAELLIRGSSFTHDGVDDEGSTNNMAAPALAALVIGFFYTGVSALGVLFPEVFSREVPVVTVCLAATTIRAALDEYTVTGVRQDRTFEYTAYSKIYASFHSMQLAIDKDPKHAAKTKALRIDWAVSALEPLNELGTIVAFDADFQPLLD